MISAEARFGQGCQRRCAQLNRQQSLLAGLSLHDRTHPRARKVERHAAQLEDACPCVAIERVCHHRVPTWCRKLQGKHKHTETCERQKCMQISTRKAGHRPEEISMQAVPPQSMRRHKTHRCKLGLAGRCAGIVLGDRSHAIAGHSHVQLCCSRCAAKRRNGGCVCKGLTGQQCSNATSHGIAALSHFLHLYTWHAASSTVPAHTTVPAHMRWHRRCLWQCPSSLRRLCWRSTAGRQRR